MFILGSNIECDLDMFKFLWKADLRHNYADPLLNIQKFQGPKNTVLVENFSNDVTSTARGNSLFRHRRQYRYRLLAGGQTTVGVYATAEGRPPRSKASPRSRRVAVRSVRPSCTTA